MPMIVHGKLDHF